MIRHGLYLHAACLESIQQVLHLYTSYFTISSRDIPQFLQLFIILQLLCIPLHLYNTSSRILQLLNIYTNSSRCILKLPNHYTTSSRDILQLLNLYTNSIRSILQLLTFFTNSFKSILQVECFNSNFIKDILHVQPALRLCRTVALICPFLQQETLKCLRKYT